MCNKKGLTLVELVVSIGLLGMIALVGLTILAFGYRYLLESRKYTHDTFTVQQGVEQLMEMARSNPVDLGDVDSYQTITLFGKEIDAHIVSEEIPASSGTAHGEINALVPQYGFEYTVPVVSTVSMEVHDGASDITAQSFYFPLDTSVVFSGSHSMGDETDFLLNVFRWYMSPVMTDPPTSKDWIIIKEWNEARTPLPYADSEDFTFIPNIEDDYDSLDFNRDFGFDDDEIGIRFGGRYFRYSVTPYSEIGRVGQEVFSNSFSTNKILSINSDPVTVYIEYSDLVESEYTIDIDTVSAMMLNGNQEVEVDWATNTIDYDQPEVGEQDTYTVNGTVIGFEDEDGIDVQFQLIVMDEYEDPELDSIQVTGPTTRIQVPTSGTVSATYTAIMLDTNGNPITGLPVTWSLDGAGTGIAINSDTGEVTVQSSAGNDPFTVRAQASGQTGQIDIRTSKADPSHSQTYSSTFTRKILGNNWITSYTIRVADDQGDPITNLAATDFYANRVYYNQSNYRQIDDYPTYTNWSNAGNGIYTWDISGNRRNNWHDSVGGVRIRYGTTDQQINPTNLDVGFD